MFYSYSIKLKSHDHYLLIKNRRQFAENPKAKLCFLVLIAVLRSTLAKYPKKQFLERMIRFVTVRTSNNNLTNSYLEARLQSTFCLYLLYLQCLNNGTDCTVVRRFALQWPALVLTEGYWVSSFSLARRENERGLMFLNVLLSLVCLFTLFRLARFLKVTIRF